MSELKPIIEQSFTQYAGAVLQSRALIDVRDGLKPSARQIFYCMDMCKYVHSKPFVKTANLAFSFMFIPSQIPFAIAFFIGLQHHIAKLDLV